MIWSHEKIVIDLSIIIHVLVFPKIFAIYVSREMIVSLDPTHQYELIGSTHEVKEIRIPIELWLYYG